MFRLFRRSRARSGASFSRIPVRAEGALFASPMPYGRYDDDRVIRYFVEEKVDRVLMLLGDEEIDRRCSKNLKGLYSKKGFSITQIPIEDFLQPGRHELWGILPELVEQLKQGERIVVHCHAGVGRTAVVIACLLGILHQESADEVIAHMRHYMDITLTPEQRTFIQNWISAANGDSTQRSGY